jgi:hypothetical protein
MRTQSTVVIKIHVLLYGDHSWTAAFKEVKSGTVKIIGIPLSFIWYVMLFDDAFIYGYGAKFWGYVCANAEIVELYKVECSVISLQSSPATRHVALWWRGDIAPTHSWPLH